MMVVTTDKQALVALILPGGFQCHRLAPPPERYWPARSVGRRGVWGPPSRSVGAGVARFIDRPSRPRTARHTARHTARPQALTALGGRGGHTGRIDTAPTDQNGPKSFPFLCSPHQACDACATMRGGEGHQSPPHYVQTTRELSVVCVAQAALQGRDACTR